MIFYENGKKHQADIITDIDGFESLSNHSIDETITIIGTGDSMQEITIGPDAPEHFIYGVSKIVTYIKTTRRGKTCTLYDVVTDTYLEDQPYEDGMYDENQENTRPLLNSRPKETILPKTKPKSKKKTKD